MNTAEFISAVRIRLDDTRIRQRVSDDTILEQATFTQIEFARATLVLYDVVSSSITAGDPWLVLPSNFFVVKSVILDTAQLRPITISELDFGYYTLTTTENINRFDEWRAVTGTPKFIITDAYPDKVRVVPIPIANAVVSIEGYVIPPAITTTVNPVIPEMYHEVLVAGTLLRLYSLFDIDVFNSSKAQVYGNQWYQGVAEAQNNLRTSLRRNIRVMELPRGFSFDTGTQTNASAPSTQAN